MRNVRSLAAEAAFRERLAGLGAKLLEPEWLGNGQRHHVRCASGHDCYPTPGNVRRGWGICVTCAGHDPAVAEAEFRAWLRRLGATPLYDQWHGANQAHHVRCAAGHDCYPWPGQGRSGAGICKTCAGQDPAVTEAKFRARVRELGGEPLYDAWRGANQKHHVRCRAGHDCHPRPARVRDGGGLCLTCAGQDPAAAEAAFRRRLAELGAVPLFDAWLGSSSPHHVRCVAGHDCWPHPSQLQRGGGICKTCAGQSPEAAEAAFRARLAELGAVPLFEKWLGGHVKHRVRCPAGHECWPRPNGVQQGKGICRTCAGRDSAAAEAEFLRTLAEFGATPLFETWHGVSLPHRVRCAGGHECYPRPDNVRQGQGICGACAGQAHSVFYVLEHQGARLVKFGISSRDGRARLARHCRRGYTTAHLLITDLPEGTARAAEDAVKSALAMAGEKSVRGHEYFDLSCLGLILDVAASWLGDARAA